MISIESEFLPLDIKRKEIQYKVMEHVDTNLHRLDIYYSSHQLRVPVVFYVHGGGLKKEDKRDEASYLDKARFLVASGYVFVSINYRLSPLVKIPSHIEDTADAFMYIYRHIDKYGGDPQKIFVMGHSAGAYLVNLLATNPSFLEQRKGNLSLIKGVISLDTEALFKVTPFLMQAMEHPSQDMHEFLPALHLQANKSIPPCIVFFNESRYETGDQISYTEALKKCDVPAAAIWCQREGHHELNQSIGKEGDRKTQMIWEFLQHPHLVEEIAKKYSYIV